MFRKDIYHGISPYLRGNKLGTLVRGIYKYKQYAHLRKRENYRNNNFLISYKTKNSPF